jgi:hypothetical protein
MDDVAVTFPLESFYQNNVWGYSTYRTIYFIVDFIWVIGPFLFLPLPLATRPAN